VQAHSQHVARAADITLATAADLTFDFDDPGYDLDLGPADGIGSQDYDIDLGLSFGDNDENMSVEQGRDAVAPRFSLDSNVLGNRDADKDLDLISNVSRHVSEDPFAPDVDMFAGDFGDIDLGLTFDNTLDKTPTRVRSPSRACSCFFPLYTGCILNARAASPLTELPDTPPPPDVDLVAAPKSPVKTKKPKAKKQIIDEVIQLADGPGAKRGRNADLGAPMTKDVSNILTQHQFLPRSATVMRLLEIREDPLAHFLPTKTTPNGTYFCAGPPGLAPELAELFMRPIHSVSPKRRADAAKSPSKKQKLMNGEDHDDVEQARRAASLDPSALDADIFARGSVGPGFDFGDTTGIGMDDFEMPVPDFDAGGADLDRARSKSVALSRMSTPAADGLPLAEGEETYADLTCAIAMFDDRSQTQPQGTQATELDTDGGDKEGRGYSKNTVKALGIIRRDLQPVGGDEGQDKVMSFKRMSEKVRSSSERFGL
jgi:cohesin complex subunit SCC1